MASVYLTDRGDCLQDLGRLDEAADAYEESIRRAEKLPDERQVAVGKGQLGTVRLLQRRCKEALKAHEEVRERFARLDEPGSVAVSWHLTGMVIRKRSSRMRLSMPTENRLRSACCWEMSPGRRAC